MSWEMKARDRGGGEREMPTVFHPSVSTDRPQKWASQDNGLVLPWAGKVSEYLA